MDDTYDKLVEGQRYDFEFNTRGYIWCVTGSFHRGITAGGKPCHCVVLCPNIHMLTLFEDRDIITKYGVHDG